MPIHDWTRVSAGIFHHFHQRWIAALCDDLNGGRLPAGYFALTEQVVGGPIPDVLTLQSPVGPLQESNGGVSTATVPPKTRFVQRSDIERYARKANRVVVRNPAGRIIAVIEIVSPGNKSSRHAVRAFVEKALDLLHEGIHLLIIDLFPPTTRDPQGIHKAIWDEVHEDTFALPTDKPLTLAAYSSGALQTAYVEPVAVGDALPEMPLFLEADVHIPVRLETTYQTSWDVFPQALKGLLETPA